MLEFLVYTFVVLLLYSTLLVAFALPIVFLYAAWRDYKRRTDEADESNGGFGGGGWRNKPTGGPSGGGGPDTPRRTVEEVLVDCVADRRLRPVEISDQVCV